MFRRVKTLITWKDKAKHTGLSINRLKAIRIMEEIANKLDRPKMFDAEWYGVEEIIVRVLDSK